MHPAPVNKAVQYIEKQFDGNLNSTSVFRGDPSPAIDATWKRVSVIGNIHDGRVVDILSHTAHIDSPGNAFDARTVLDGWRE